MQLSAFVGEVLPLRFVKHPGRPSNKRSDEGAASFGLGTPEGPGNFRAGVDFDHPEKNRNRNKRRPAASRQSPSGSKVCLTPSCVKAAARMLDNMDDKVHFISEETRNWNLHAVWFIRDGL